jgi:hypothetical protein
MAAAAMTVVEDL